MLRTKHIIQKKFLGGLFQAAAPFLGSVVQTGGQVFGGIQGRQQQEKLFDENLRFQDDLAKNGLSYRVSDAVAAAKEHGFHPYALLNAGSYQAPGAYVGDDPLGRSISDASQNLGGALNRVLDPTGRKHRQLQNDLLQSQIDLNKARAIAVQQPSIDPNVINEVGGGVAVPQGRVTVGPLTEIERGPGIDAFEGQIRVTPPRRKTGKPGTYGIESGVLKGYQEYELPNGMPIMLPATDEGMSEAFQNLGILGALSVVLQNAEAYGGNYINDLKDFALGSMKPKGYYMGQAKAGPRRKREHLKFDKIEDIRGFIGNLVDTLTMYENEIRGMFGRPKVKNR